jgi:hypothetical protein
VDATVIIDTKGQLIKKTAFFVRAGNSTRELDPAEKAKYALGRWPSGNMTHESTSAMQAAANPGRAGPRDRLSTWKR